MVHGAAELDVTVQRSTRLLFLHEASSDMPFSCVFSDLVIFVSFSLDIHLSLHGCYLKST